MDVRHGRKGRSTLTTLMAALAASFSIGAVGGAAVSVAAGAGSGTAAAASKSAASKSAAPQPSPISSLQCPAGLGTGSPGVSAKEVKVAAISTESGPIAADFGSLVPGAKAYFDMIDAQGGVNGRKIVLAYTLNDQGTNSRFQTLTHTAIDQDHAFATIISSYWFSPTYFTSTCTPTYGYNVSGDWTKAPNLYAAGGSVQTYKTLVPAIAYLSKQVKAKSVAALAYGVSSSSDACQADVNGLKSAGYTVPYSDLKLTPLNPDLTPDVQRLKEDGVGLIVTCMTVDGNVALAREVKEYGLEVKMLWLTVVDQSVLDKDSKLMQGVYFNVPNVPLQANKKFPGTYPSVTTYLAAMRKYEPSYAGSNVALQGWESAALLAAGIKAAGSDLTQANLVKVTNQMTSFTAGGLYTPMNWTTTHTEVNAPFCSAFAQVQGKKLEPVLGKGKQVFLCFKDTVKHVTPAPTRAGAPGPHES